MYSFPWYLHAGMIVGTSVATVYYNLKLKHPALDRPLIDYDLALLIQPMLMLGISIGVVFNVIFPDWLVTVLLIVLFLGSLIYLSRFQSRRASPRLLTLKRLSN
jgi:uncharacterized membrane protein YfcA